MSDKIPQDAFAIIIGSMKCGTSSLFSYLNGHPEICGSSVKEPEFFSKKKDLPPNTEQYTDLWQFDRKIHKYALEASTGYTKYPTKIDIPKYIFRFGIKPRFIYIVRNPFDRIESHYNFMQKDESWGSNITGDHLIHTSNYYLQLERYLRFFPAESILVLDFEELKKNPVRLLEQTYQFLNISSNYFPGEFETKNRTYMESPIERKIKASKLGKLIHYVPSPAKDIGKKLIRKEKRKLTDNEKGYIHSKLKDDMLAFSRKYDFDVEKWGF